MRRFGEAVKAGQTYRARPGAYALVREGRDLLITEATVPDVEFQLPGGGIDPGEHPIPALHREVEEETGWRVAVQRRVGVYQRFTFMPEYDLWARKVCHVFLCRPVRRLGPPTEAGHSALWMPIAQAARLLGSPGDRWFAAALAP